MHTVYNFHFLETISQQLHAALAALPVTDLTPATLANLVAAQNQQHAAQGVYFLHLDGQPFYLGKADNVAARLAEHLEKLRGRQGIDPTLAGYKAILLDRSMSTAANEKILIQMFGPSHAGMWNGKGFGPKDPGQERDTTKPSKFDKQHPIRSDYPLTNIPDAITVAALFEALKAQLPYLFRYDLGTSTQGAVVLNLAGVPRTALGLLQAAMAGLEPGWRGAVLSYGMVVYKTDKTYRFASQVFDSPP